MAFNDAVDWRTDLGGGTTVALVQAGTFRTDAGAIFGPVPRLLWGGLVTDEIDHDHRLLQALNCLLVETPSGRVLVETGIGVSLISRLAVVDELEQGRLCRVPLRGIAAPRPVYLLIHRDKHRTPAIRAFQALLPPLAVHEPPLASSAS